MPEFLNLFPPADALDKLMAELVGFIPKKEWIDSAQALGRTTAVPVISSEDLPSFSRSTVDGYAVRAEDTYGANDSLPAYLRLIGEVPMGESPVFKIGESVTALIHTGGMLPDGANAVVMVEHTQVSRQDEVEILKAVALGENVLFVGEDVKRGDEVIPSGINIRPAEIGGLMALGISRIEVAVSPKVGIISSGDEVISPNEVPRPGQVRDINSYTLSALVEENGGTAVRYGIVMDKPDTLKQTLRNALKECDLVVITAGSSASTRDLTADVIDAMGNPGVLVHGVSVRPGKPTILAVCDGIPVIGLPGNPLSALLIARIFITPILNFLLGRNEKILAKNRMYAVLSTNIPSQAGREDWVPVKISESEDGFFVEPIFFKSNFIFNLIKADGLIKINPSANGIGSGEIVEVYPI